MNSALPACTYRVLEGNIHEFVVNEISRRAVDVIFDTSIELLRQDPNKPYPGLVDARIGSLPLDYMLTRARQVAKQFPNRVPARVVVLVSTGPLVHVASIFLRPLLPIRLYKPHEREQALAWLRAQAAPKR